jgi:KipI family sensor histidine kinase inhibitor
LIHASDHSLLVSFAPVVSEETHRSVLRLSRLLDGARELVNIHPAYCSVLLTFDPRRTEHQHVESRVRQALERLDTVELPAPRTVEVPVRYGGADGPDLDELASLHGMKPAEVVQIHSSADYLVCFLGFSPGYPYLSGLPSELATPRLSVPRTHVPAGSVAIGGDHAGIYPVASPGGWRIIGRTPLILFQPDRAPVTLLNMGDHVRFLAA